MDRRSVLISSAAAASTAFGLADTAFAQRTTAAEPKMYEAEVLLPPPFPTPIKQLDAGPVTDGFSVDVQGYGSITGLAYKIPAHTDADFDIDLKILSLTSADVANLNKLIEGMVGASKWEKVRDYERTHASANLSFWSVLSGGGGASYEKIHEAASGFGLSEENQRTIVSAMSEVAKNMSKVACKVHVKNALNNYAVSGNMIVFTIAGTVRTNNQQYQFQMIADQGLAGSGSQTAPTDNQIVAKLN